MSWLANAVLYAIPVLVVMSILALVAPSLRHRSSWRGVGLAWVGLIVVTFVVAITHLDQFSLICPGGIRVVVGPTDIGLQQPCRGVNALDAWLVALPGLVGIAVLLAWIGRRVHPWTAATGNAAFIAAVAVGAIALGEVSEALALLAFFAAVAALLLQPRLEGRLGHSGPTPG